jgi:hypothetical protein
MLLASLLTLFTLNERYQSFNRFFDLSVSRVASEKVKDIPVDPSQLCELLLRRNMFLYLSYSVDRYMLPC